MSRKFKQKMDYRGRRGRRGRNCGRSNPPTPVHSFTPHQKPWSLLSSFCSFMIMLSLVALIYLMFDYQCRVCSNSAYDLSNITFNIENIAKNVSLMKESYSDLEKKVSKFSQELPKLEGQIEILESLANTLDNDNFGWNHKSHLRRGIDVFLSAPIDSNAYIKAKNNTTTNLKQPQRIQKQ